MSKILDELRDILKESGYIITRADHSHHVRDWPKDEQEAYRDNHGFQAGSEAVNRVRADKVLGRMEEYIEGLRAEDETEHLLMHHAYRPEAVAEVCVYLGDNADWDEIATWCGGKVVSIPAGDSGEYSDFIEIPTGASFDPSIGLAWDGSWIYKTLDGNFAVRNSIGDPDGDTLRLSQADAIEKLSDMFPSVTRDMVSRSEVKEWLLSISKDVQEGRTL